MRLRPLLRHAAPSVALSALLSSIGCTDTGAAPSNDARPTSSDQGGSGGGAGGSGGAGDTGIDPHGDASAGGDPDSGASGRGGSSGATDSDGSAPAPDAGSDADKPVCDAAANGGVGACKPIEVLAFYTEYEKMDDLAHRSYSREANAWFPKVAGANGFTYESTTDWNRLKGTAPERGRVIMFFDDRPFAADQQAAFESYMENGGAFIGFHVSAYNDSPSDWDWYFNQLLGSGGFDGNTWRPTSALLRVEDEAHPVTRGLGPMFTASPNEWYAWKVDLRTKSNIKILCSIDPSSFPLGTGPKPYEIWHSGYYPVVWTNTRYKMLYVNMGHNDMDYGGTNQQLSWTFDNPTQDRMLLNAIQWLGGAKGSL
jgi:hypothetical protein